LREERTPRTREEKENASTTSQRGRRVLSTAKDRVLYQTGGKREGVEWGSASNHGKERLFKGIPLSKKREGVHRCRRGRGGLVRNVARRKKERRTFIHISTEETPVRRRRDVPRTGDATLACLFKRGEKDEAVMINARGRNHFQPGGRRFFG